MQPKTVTTTFLLILATALATTAIVREPLIAQGSGNTAAAFGRYVAITAPIHSQDPTGGDYDNFLWVLDTESGSVRLHRISYILPSTGEKSGTREYMSDELPTVREYFAGQQSKK